MSLVDDFKEWEGVYQKANRMDVFEKVVKELEELYRVKGSMEEIIKDIENMIENYKEMKKNVMAQGLEKALEAIKMRIE